MKTVTLGSTGITVPQNGFGALPVQRDDMETSIKILRRAYEGGMTFFDTARAYSDSEEKIGKALCGANGDGYDIRSNIFIATKTMGKTPDEVRADIEMSLKLLNTDYIDIYQFHCIEQVYLPGDGTGMYECMQELKAQGKIRHIGLTAHKIHLAEDAVKSGLYETLQYPFSYISSEREVALSALCKEHNVGLIGMKGLAGGLIHDSKAAFAFVSQFDNIVPIWGVQRMTELEEWLAFFDTPATMTDEIRTLIEKDKKELGDNFCRSCGYCMPCPQGIGIRHCARMSLMLRRAPSKNWLSEHWQEEMKKTENCTGCGACKSKCPYGLDTPALLKKNYEDYKNVLAGKVSVQ